MNKPVVEPTFAVGQFVMHADAGVGKIEDVVTETVLGTEVKCYLVVCERVRAKVPVTNAHSKLRPLSDRAVWQEAPVILSSKPQPLPYRTHQLEAKCAKRMQLGTVEALCGVLKDTVQRKTSQGDPVKEISPTMRGIFNTVWTRLVDLYAVTFAVSQDEAEKKLRDMCPAEFDIPVSAYGNSSFKVPAGVRKSPKAGQRSRSRVQAEGGVTADPQLTMSPPSSRLTEEKPKPKVTAKPVTRVKSKAVQPVKPVSNFAPRSYTGSPEKKAIAPASVRPEGPKKASAKKETSSPTSAAASKMAELEGENRALAAQVAQLQVEKMQQAAEAESEKIRLVQRLEDARKSIARLNNMLSQREQEIHNFRRRLQELQRELKQVSAQPTNLAEVTPREDLSLQKVLELEEQNRQLRSKLGVSRTQVTKHKNARAKLKREVLTARKIERRIEKVRRELFAFIEERTSRVEQLEALLREERTKRQ